jgi:hypothetical protein
LSVTPDALESGRNSVHLDSVSMGLIILPVAVIPALSFRLLSLDHLAATPDAALQDCPGLCHPGYQEKSSKRKYQIAE